MPFILLGAATMMYSTGQAICAVNTTRCGSSKGSCRWSSVPRPIGAVCGGDILVI